MFSLSPYTSLSSHIHHLLPSFSSSASMLALALEVQTQVLLYLSHKEVAVLESVCSQTNKLVSDTKCWQASMRTGGDEMGEDEREAERI